MFINGRIIVTQDVVIPSIRTEDLLMPYQFFKSVAMVFITHII